MKKMVTVLFVSALAIQLTGCASYMSYKSSEEEIYKQRVMASGDQDAIHGMRMGVPARTAVRAIQEPGVLGLALDLGSLDVLSEHPWRQIGAALLDAGTAYGAYLALDELDSGGSSSSKSKNGGGGTTVEGNPGDTTVVNIDGTGNEVTINADGGSVDPDATVVPQF